MKYLVDTSVWLELLLEQDRAEEVRGFLELVAASDLVCTEFTASSIGLVLTRLQRWEVLRQFITDVFINAGVQRVALEPQDFLVLIDTMRDLGLDFDDAYQYVAALRYQLILVSMDAHFDRTPLGRKTPAEVVALL